MVGGIPCISSLCTFARFRACQNPPWRCGPGIFGIRREDARASEPTADVPGGMECGPCRNESTRPKITMPIRWHYPQHAGRQWGTGSVPGSRCRSWSAGLSDLRPRRPPPSRAHRRPRAPHSRMPEEAILPLFHQCGDRPGGGHLLSFPPSVGVSWVAARRFRPLQCVDPVARRPPHRIGLEQDAPAAMATAQAPAASFESGVAPSRDVLPPEDAPEVAAARQAGDPVGLVHAHLL
jgi:hypothetical protein